MMGWTPEQITALRRRLALGAYRVDHQKGHYPACVPDVDRMSDERREAFLALDSQATHLAKCRDALRNMTDFALGKLDDPSRADEMRVFIEARAALASDAVVDAAMKKDAHHG